MTDKITRAQRSENMSRIRSRDTKPELVVRRLLHRLGYRFRLHRRDLPGKPDITFPSRKSVIFVHGCFWHQHPKKNCADARPPKSNVSYWSPKLKRNVERDALHHEALRRMGWRSIVVWECETADPIKLSKKIKKILVGEGE